MGLVITVGLIECIRITNESQALTVMHLALNHENKGQYLGGSLSRLA